MAHLRAPRGGFRTVDLRNLPLVLVLTLSVTGIGYSAAVPRHWLRGVLVLAGAMMIAGVLRLLLPARQAGLLAVRSRAFDVLCYCGTGVAIIAFGLALPA
jgi:Protein of unknown function (DUF3017)